MSDPSLDMRRQLAMVGIQLDDERPLVTRRQAPTVEAIDRVAIFMILRAAGAPRHDLDWMTASCPSMACARAYRPTERVT